MKRLMPIAVALVAVLAIAVSGSAQNLDVSGEPGFTISGPSGTLAPHVTLCGCGPACCPPGPPPPPQPTAPT